MNEISIIIISGLSGAGKSTALRTFEDLGFYCVDNLPIILLPNLVEICQSSGYDIARIALVIDVREGSFLNQYKPILDSLRNKGAKIEQIYLECSDDILMQRFNETRRQHPLCTGGTLRDSIELERIILREIKTGSDESIDTSKMNVHQLRDVIQKKYKNVTIAEMVIAFISFGFKYGSPNDSDIMFDVRFMPNPYFDGELKNLTGNDGRIIDYVFESSESNDYFERLIDFLSFQIPLFQREGKSYLTVAVGCTGGRHRSVVIANALKNYYEKQSRIVHVIHRDLDKQ